MMLHPSSTRSRAKDVGLGLMRAVKAITYTPRLPARCPSSAMCASLSTHLALRPWTFTFRLRGSTHYPAKTCPLPFSLPFLHLLLPNLPQLQHQNLLSHRPRQPPNHAKVSAFGSQHSGSRTCRLARAQQEDVVLRRSPRA
ncbi:hypothetical protein IEO21_11040 [Rhodonia placenta]|uniref:Uncharacterized protein n=1 Tax=Rhodonia placenta TaxID=104341 RepID=A0A8H7NRB7_9APHY|nr:hypothetical protein IEO21_11040 [Postia placenta]